MKLISIINICVFWDVFDWILGKNKQLKGFSGHVVVLVINVMI